MIPEGAGQDLITQSRRGDSCNYEGGGGAQEKEEGRKNGFIFIHSFIHFFKICLWIPFSLPGVILGIWGNAVLERDKSPAHRELTF